MYIRSVHPLYNLSIMVLAASDDLVDKVYKIL